jgi:hypothetical protein
MRRDVVKKRSSSALQISRPSARRWPKTLRLFLFYFSLLSIFFDFWFDSSNGIKEREKKKQIIKSKISEYITPLAYTYTCPVSPSTLYGHRIRPIRLYTASFLELSERHLFLENNTPNANKKRNKKTSAMQWMMASYTLAASKPDNIWGAI